MKKTYLFFILVICCFLFWDYTELKTPGGLGFIRNNLVWLLITSFISYQFWQLSSKQEGLFYSSHSISFALFGITLAIVPTLLNLQYADYSLLLPVGLLLAYAAFVCFVNNHWGQNNPVYILSGIIIVAMVETVFAGIYLIHRIAMDLTSNVSPNYPNLSLNFNQRNLFASFLSTGLMSALFLLLKKSINSKFIKLLQVFTFFGIFILFITESRVGIYSFLFGAALLLATHALKQKRLVMHIGLIALVAIICSYSFSSMVYGGAKKDFSQTQARNFIYQTSFEAILEKPFSGHGLGSFNKVYLEQAGKRIRSNQVSYKEISGRPENMSHPHNEFLYWGVQGGFISILGLLILALTIYWRLFKLKISIQLGYIALLTPILLHLMVELPFYNSGLHLILLISLAGFIGIDSSTLEPMQLKNRVYQWYFKAISIVTFLISIFVIPANIYSLSQAVNYQTALNRDYQSLENAQYPIGWANDLQALKLKHHANIAAKKGEKEPIKAYLAWLIVENERYPILQNYFNLYYSYKFLGKPKKANIILEEVKTKYKGVVTAEEWLKQMEVHSSRLKD